MSNSPSDPTRPESTPATPAVPAACPPRGRRRGSCLALLFSLGGWTLLVLTLAVLAVLLWSERLHFRPAEKLSIGRPSYEATVLFHLQPTAHLLREDRPAPRGESSPADFQRLQAILLRSSLVLKNALKQPAVASLAVIKEQDDPASWLGDRLQIDTALGPEILRVRLIGEQPEELRTLLNAVADTYLQEIVFKEHNSRLQRIEGLTDLSRTLDTQLKAKRDLLNEVARHVGGKKQEHLALQQRLALEQRNLAEKDLVSFRRERMTTRVELATLEAKEKALLEAPVPEPLIQEHLEKQSAIRDLRAREKELNAQLEAMKRNASDPETNPGIKELRKTLQANQAALAERQKELRLAAVKEARDQIARETRAQIEGLKAKDAFSVRLEQELEATINQYSQLAQNLNAGAVKVETISHDVAAAEALANRVADELAALEAEKTAPPRVRRLDEVTVRKVR